MILIIDNYDSFTFNLVQYIGSLNYNMKIVKNDEITIDDIEKLNPDKIVISPGPGNPKDAGISIATIKNFYKKIPILGICLGHQAIALAFGGKIITSNEICHGKVVEITHSNSAIFNYIPKNFHATRYHSLVIDPTSIPEEINIIATNNFYYGQFFFDDIFMDILKSKAGSLNADAIIFEKNKKDYPNYNEDYLFFTAIRFKNNHSHSTILD